MTNPFKYFQEKKFCQQVVAEHIGEEDWRTPKNDRVIFEETIIPWYLSMDPHRILDVGREDYQGFYNDFFSGRELWTLDYDQERCEFGAENHICDSAANLGKHFEKDYFDLILMNGVFGWGLNDPKEIDRAFGAVVDLLYPGGHFLLGWNNLPDSIPLPLDQIPSLKRLNSHFCWPLWSRQYECANGRHTYTFFRKAL